MAKKIMLLNANPVKESFSHACSDAYVSAATAAGAEVRRFNIGEMDFDPTLHNGYKVIQELEPVLREWQDAVSWADMLVFVYPNWWNTMPAKMKGLFDRAFLPQFAFRFENHCMVPLLTEKQATIINIVGSSNPFMLWFKMGSYTNELSHGILKMCGVESVKTVGFGPTRSSSQAQRDRWLERVGQRAQRDVLQR